MIIRGITTAIKRLQYRSVPNALIWWGSFWRDGVATIGDVHAVENLSRQLAASDFDHVVVSKLPLAGVSKVVNDCNQLPSTLRKIVFVCGPIVANQALFETLDAYPSARKIAVGVSVIANQEVANARFNKILDRQAQGAGFDLALARFDGLHRMQSPRREDHDVICLVGAQSEYGADRPVLNERAERMLLEGLRNSGRAIRPITTVIDPQSNSENDIVQSIERAQVMATTRMHGALYALAYGCPVVAIDQISGGAKVSAILERIGWPLVFRADLVDDAALRAAFERARSPEIAAIVDRCRADAIRRSKIALAEAVRLIVH